MTKSQNTKNEQQKDLCITSEQLTEQWKKGELPVDKDYYIKLKCGLILIDYYCQLYDNCRFPNGIGFDSIPENDIEQVLAPVPSYDEWVGVKQQRDLENKLRHDSDNRNWQLRTQNAQLKELLKECRGSIATLQAKRITEVNGIKQKELLDKIDEALK